MTERVFFWSLAIVCGLAIGAAMPSRQHEITRYAGGIALDRELPRESVAVARASTPGVQLMPVAFSPSD